MGASTRIVLSRAAGVFLAVVGLLAAGVYLLDAYFEGENQVSRCETLAGGDGHRAPGCGWLPEFVPASSKRIVEVHNIDSNEICARFEIERQDEALFTETLVLQGFEPYSGLPVPPRRFSSRHPCPFSADDLRSARLFYRKVRSGLPPHEYFAIAGGSLVAYYWTAYEPSLNGRADR